MGPGVVYSRLCFWPMQYKGGSGKQGIVWVAEYFSLNGDSRESAWRQTPVRQQQARILFRGATATSRMREKKQRGELTGSFSGGFRISAEGRRPNDEVKFAEVSWRCPAAETWKWRM